MRVPVARKSRFVIALAVTASSLIVASCGAAQDEDLVTEAEPVAVAPNTGVEYRGEPVPSTSTTRQVDPEELDEFYAAVLATTTTSSTSTTAPPPPPTTAPPTLPPTTAAPVTQPPATTAPAPAPVPAPAPTATYGSGACGGDLPPCYVMMRESGGSITAQNPTSTASGKWQFLDSTWQGYGGYAKASYAPEHIQDEKARQLWAGGAGCFHWSAC